MNKRLTKSDVAKIAEMLATGKSISEVADYLSVSQATIYNQKAKLIREGFKLPEVKRGRKPANSGSANNLASSKQIIKTSRPFDEYRFLINNVSISISGKAKDVYVSKEEMRIIF
jgi:transposase